MLITNGAVAFYFKLNTMTTNGGINEVSMKIKELHKP